MEKWAVGIDFGGTNIKVGLVSRGGILIRQQVLRSSEFAAPAAFATGVSDAVKTLCRLSGLRRSQIAGMGLGAPGPVDGARGIVRFLVNVPGWRNVPLASQLQRRLKFRCLIDNDANLFALAEWRYGAARNCRHAVCVTLGTGVGGGLILDGALYHGSAGAAGEIGHTIIDLQGPRCACGRRGCLEAMVGTSGILHLARQWMGKGRLTPAMISFAARKGDRQAKRVWKEVGRFLGIGVANWVNLLNPEKVVIGGGVAKAWPWFYPMLQDVVQAEAFEISARSVRVVPAQLGDSAGMIGAAALVWQNIVPRSEFCVPSSTRNAKHGTRNKSFD
ncbi:MAG: ROK family protein [Candidatus Omnitrophica bacterium]|nr:ROK family protein [Candidatus Omnitrophota bacterium]MBI3010623.1 ROK family protein [Candidatus Omnitrophota bacterium]